VLLAQFFPQFFVFLPVLTPLMPVYPLQARFSPSKSPVFRGALPLLLCLGGLILGSCDSYSRLLKSQDIPLKLSKAREYYHRGDYYRAQPLLEELNTLFRGSEVAGELQFMSAYTSFHERGYELAAFQFQQLASSFSGNSRGEEAAFMHAYCLYLNSPEFGLDQKNTESALEGLQLYINKYPKSGRVADCHRFMDVLREKLEKKALDRAMLFYKMEDHRAATALLKRTLTDFPDIEQREYLLYLLTDSYHKLAVNSIPSKQAERCAATLLAAMQLTEEYPKSKYLKPTEKMTREVGELQARLNQTASIR
jgi:outer membrane protein assembly factor BamD